MALIISKFEDEANQNVRFDYTKFDYMYDDDSFPTDAQEDFEQIILENGDMFSVIRQVTTKDTMGSITGVAESSFRAWCWITDISKKDRQIEDMGLAVAGNRICYFKHEYVTTSGGVDTTNIVKEGDIFVDRNSKKWRIIKIIHEPHLNASETYKKAVVQSIGLGRSS